MLINSGQPPDPNALAIFGPTVKVDIGLDESFDQSQLPALPSPKLQGVLALIDTGAMESCIDAELAEALDLLMCDQKEMAGAVGDPRVVNMYLAQIVVQVSSRRILLLGEFAGINLWSHHTHRVLLDREFLRDFVFTYQGRTGEVTLTHADTLA